MKHESGMAGRPRVLPGVEDFTRAKASYAVGGGIEHIVMGQWLLTWGKPGRKPFADWLDDQDG